MVKLTQVKARSFGLKCFKLFYFQVFIWVYIYVHVYTVEMYIHVLYISNVDQEKYQLSGFIYPSAHGI